jgi:hypothetical protein
MQGMHEKKRHLVQDFPKGDEVLDSTNTPRSPPYLSGRGCITFLFLHKASPHESEGKPYAEKKREAFPEYVCAGGDLQKGRGVKEQRFPCVIGKTSYLIPPPPPKSF